MIVTVVFVRFFLDVLNCLIKKRTNKNVIFIFCAFWSYFKIPLSNCFRFCVIYFSFFFLLSTLILFIYSVPEMANLKGKNVKLYGQPNRQPEQKRSQLAETSGTIRNNKANSRRSLGQGWSSRGEQGSAADCTEKWATIFIDQVGARTEPVPKEDIELADCSGNPGGSKSRPLWARFHSRHKRRFVPAAYGTLGSSSIIHRRTL